MRNSSILLVPLLIAGCATPPPVVMKTPAPNILAKLQVNARTEALVVAVQRGIIDIEQN